METMQNEGHGAGEREIFTGKFDGIAGVERRSLCRRER